MGVSKEASVGSIRVIRWIIVGLSAALAVALIARGNVIIGVLIGALAVSRALLLMRIQRRRRRFRRRRLLQDRWVA
jgi:Flp pilus assembly protein TadB